MAINKDCPICGLPLNLSKNVLTEIAEILGLASKICQYHNEESPIPNYLLERLNVCIVNLFLKERMDG